MENLFQGLPLAGFLHGIGQDPAPRGIAAEPLSGGICDLVLQGGHILASFEGGTGPVGVGGVEPASCVEHQQLRIVVGSGIEGPEGLLIPEELGDGVGRGEPQGLVEGDAAVGNPVAEDGFDIRRPGQVLVVVRQDDAVLRALEVGFEIVRDRLSRPAPGAFRFLGRPVGRAAMGHDGVGGYSFGASSAGREEGQQEAECRDPVSLHIDLSL